jgi:hypothetical protein
MKMSKTAALGVGACAAACVGVSVLPLLAGAGLVGLGGLGTGAWLGGMSLEAIVCGGGLMLTAGGVAAYFAFRTKPVASNAVSCSTDASCICKPSQS